MKFAAGGRALDWRHGTGSPVVAILPACIFARPPHLSHRSPLLYRKSVTWMPFLWDVRAIHDVINSAIGLQFDGHVIFRLRQELHDLFNASLDGQTGIQPHARLCWCQRMGRINKKTNQKKRCRRGGHKSASHRCEKSTNDQWQARKYHEMPYLVMLKKVEKLSWIHYRDRIHSHSLIASKGSSLAHAYHVWSTSINEFELCCGQSDTRTPSPTLTLANTRVITVPVLQVINELNCANFCELVSAAIWQRQLVVIIHLLVYEVCFFDESVLIYPNAP